MRRKAKPTALKKFLSKLWNFMISNVGAFVIGFSALVIGLYQYYVNRPILKYDAMSHSFISSQNDNNFKVIVENKEYNDLYQTIVILKNNGQQPLDGKDVSQIGHDPIRIVVPGNAEMVHFTLDKVLTSDAVTAQTQLYDGNIILKFDFLNPGDQIAVTILHKQPSDGFYITGSALGVTNISHVLTHKEILIIVVGLMLGVYLLTIILEILDRKGYL